MTDWISWQLTSSEVPIEHEGFQDFQQWTTEQIYHTFKVGHHSSQLILSIGTDSVREKTV